jgi:hypothetical protein
MVLNIQLLHNAPTQTPTVISNSVSPTVMVVVFISR